MPGVVQKLQGGQYGWSGMTKREKGRRGGWWGGGVGRWGAVSGAIPPRVLEATMRTLEKGVM